MRVLSKKRQPVKDKRVWTECYGIRSQKRPNVLATVYEISPSTALLLCQITRKVRLRNNKPGGVWYSLSRVWKAPLNTRDHRCMIVSALNSKNPDDTKT